MITNHGKIEIINKQSIVHKYKHTSSRNDRRKKMLLLLARVDLTEKCPVLSRLIFLIDTCIQLKKGYFVDVILTGRTEPKLTLVELPSLD